jgi:hypothetical protein
MKSVLARVVRGELTGHYMSLTDLRNVRVGKMSLADVVHFLIGQCTRLLRAQDAADYVLRFRGCAPHLAMRAS